MDILDRIDEYVNKPDKKAPKIPESIRKKMNNEIYELTKEYQKGIPLGPIDKVLRKYGYLLIQEDNTPWEGFISGRDGRDNFNIGELKSVSDGAYTAVQHYLVLTWHKMDVSGKYEVVAYVS